MDQLIPGYGLANNNTGNNPPPGYQNNSILNTTNNNPNQLKKQMTLNEKQEMASRLEKEEHKSGLQSSMSLRNINSNKQNTTDLTDSLFDRNLADLNINNKMTPNNNLSLLSQQMAPVPFHHQQQQSSSFMNKPTGQFASPVNNNNNGLNSSLNQNRGAGQLSNQQQLGFFGNLALPAPPSSQGPSLNAMKSSNKTTTTTNSPSASLIPPPPKSALSSQIASNNSQTNAGKKTALDDLADIFG
jgi:hypothetical protein